MARPKKEVEETVDLDPAEVQDSAPMGATTKAKKSPYPLFDLWQIDPKSLRDGRYELTAVKIKRTNVKISQVEADMLNEQSHNSRQRFYLQGSITNGNTETITIK